MTPLEDPAYRPAYPPLPGGLVPEVVARWGPRSQLRWFNRFCLDLHPQRAGFWDRFYCSSTAHRGQCCASCVADILDGYRDLDECCCRALRAALTG